MRRRWFGVLSDKGGIVTAFDTSSSALKSRFQGAVGALKSAAITHPVASGLAYAATGALAIAALRGLELAPEQARLACAAACAALCALADRLRPNPSLKSSANAALAGFCVGPWLPFVAAAYSGGQVFYGMSKLSRFAAERRDPPRAPAKAMGPK